MPLSHNVMDKSARVATKGPHVAKSATQPETTTGSEQLKESQMKQILRWKREKELALKKKKSLKDLMVRQSDIFEGEGGSIGNKGTTDMGRGSGTAVMPGPDGGSGVAPAPPATKAKKPKGMQLDSVYREYQGKFLDETATLSGYIERWTISMAKGDEVIPDEIVGDIESFVGQAKLLLESKLPQFAELLYFYLSRHADPHLLLPCDLDGWWAVAEISIEKVKRGFVNVDAAVQKASPHRRN